MEFQNLKSLVKKNRSYRRFKQDYAVMRDELLDLIDLARLTPSAANRQPLRYILSCDEETNALIFPHLAWAAYLKGWNGPAEGERPSAYIIILNDTALGMEVDCDHGIAAQTILLGAAAKGLGGCMIAAIQKEALRQALAIPERYRILLVIAIGKPSETVVIETVGPDGDIRYWRDEDGVHHVPKRSLDEIVLDL